MKTLFLTLLLALTATVASAKQSTDGNGYDGFTPSAPGEIRVSPANDSR